MEELDFEASDIEVDLLEEKTLFHATESAAGTFSSSTVTLTQETTSNIAAGNRLGNPQSSEGITSNLTPSVTSQFYMNKNSSTEKAAKGFKISDAHETNGACFKDSVIINQANISGNGLTDITSKLTSSAQRATSEPQSQSKKLCNPPFNSALTQRSLPIDHNSYTQKLQNQSSASVEFPYKMSSLLLTGKNTGSCTVNNDAVPNRASKATYVKPCPKSRKVFQARQSPKTKGNSKTVESNTSVCKQKKNTGRCSISSLCRDSVKKRDSVMPILENIRRNSNDNDGLPNITKMTCAMDSLAPMPYTESRKCYDTDDKSKVTDIIKPSKDLACKSLNATIAGDKRKLSNVRTDDMVLRGIQHDRGTPPTALKVLTPFTRPAACRADVQCEAFHNSSSVQLITERTKPPANTANYTASLQNRMPASTNKIEAKPFPISSCKSICEHSSDVIPRSMFTLNANDTITFQDDSLNHLVFYSKAMVESLLPAIYLKNANIDKHLRLKKLPGETDWNQISEEMCIDSFVYVFHDTTGELASPYQLLRPYCKSTVTGDLTALKVKDLNIDMVVNTDLIKANDFPKCHTAFVYWNPRSILLFYGIEQFLVKPSTICSYLEDPSVHRKSAVKHRRSPKNFLKVFSKSFPVDARIISYSLKYYKDLFNKIHDTRVTHQPRLRLKSWKKPKHKRREKIEQEASKTTAPKECDNTFEGFDAVSPLTSMNRKQKSASQPPQSLSLLAAPIASQPKVSSSNMSINHSMPSQSSPTQFNSSSFNVVTGNTATASHSHLLKQLNESEKKSTSILTNTPSKQLNQSLTDSERKFISSLTNTPSKSSLVRYKKQTGRTVLQSTTPVKSKAAALLKKNSPNIQHEPQQINNSSILAQGSMESKLIARTDVTKVKTSKQSKCASKSTASIVSSVNKAKRSQFANTAPGNSNSRAFNKTVNSSYLSFGNTSTSSITTVTTSLAATMIATASVATFTSLPTNTVTSPAFMATALPGYISSSLRPTTESATLASPLTNIKASPLSATIPSPVLSAFRSSQQIAAPTSQLIPRAGIDVGATPSVFGSHLSATVPSRTQSCNAARVALTTPISLPLPLTTPASPSVLPITTFASVVSKLSSTTVTTSTVSSSSSSKASLAATSSVVLPPQTKGPIQPTPLEIFSCPRNLTPTRKKLNALSGLYEPEKIFKEDGCSYR